MAADENDQWSAEDYNDAWLAGDARRLLQYHEHINAKDRPGNTSESLRQVRDRTGGIGKSTWRARIRRFQLLCSSPVWLQVFFKQSVKLAPGWCRWWDLNPHGCLRPQDFKSCASAISPHRQVVYLQILTTNQLRSLSCFVSRRLQLCSIRWTPRNPASKKRHHHPPSDGRWRSFPKVPHLRQYIISGNCFGKVKNNGRTPSTAVVISAFQLDSTHNSRWRPSGMSGWTSSPSAVVFSLETVSVVA